MHAEKGASWLELLIIFGHGHPECRNMFPDTCVSDRIRKFEKDVKVASGGLVWAVPGGPLRGSCALPASC
eukprot:10508517-Alexandrium_andersonii.AAC.1